MLGLSLAGSPLPFLTHAAKLPARMRVVRLQVVYYSVWVNSVDTEIQELAEYQSGELGNPAEFWSYKDEDFMGIVAGLAFRRGGALNPTTTTVEVLERFCVWLANPAMH